MKYRKRPIIVEANQFNHPATAPIGVRTREDGSAYVVTIHGQETDVVPGDWIILEDPPGDGTLAYPCKPDVFESCYERIVTLEDVVEFTCAKCGMKRTKVYSIPGRYAVQCDNCTHLNLVDCGELKAVEF